jgi:hypothetical protein
VSAGSWSDADRPRRVAVPVVDVPAVVAAVVPPPSPRRRLVPLLVPGPAAPPVAGPVASNPASTYPNEQSGTELPEQLNPAFIAQYHLTHRSGDEPGGPVT